MTTCNATLTVYALGDGNTNPHRQEIRCTRGDAGHLDHEGPGDDVIWNDNAPGARPHQDPTPTYRAKSFGSTSWQVWVDEDGDWAAFYSPRHPDPQGAAEAEAARLRQDLYDPLVDPQVHARLARERDEAVLGRKREAADNDRLRQALDAISAVDRRTAGGEEVSLLRVLREVGEYARRALEVQP